MMSGHDANPIFFNKKKYWTSRTLANPHPPPTSNNISFLPFPTLSQSGCHMCITPVGNPCKCNKQGVFKCFSDTLLKYLIVN